MSGGVLAYCLLAYMLTADTAPQGPIGRGSHFPNKKLFNFLRKMEQTGRF